MSKNQQQYNFLNDLHKRYQPEDGDCFRHISMRFNDGAALFDRVGADNIHLAWHKDRNIPVPVGAIFAQKTDNSQELQS